MWSGEGGCAEYEWGSGDRGEGGACRPIAGHRMARAPRRLKRERAPIQRSIRGWETHTAIESGEERNRDEGEEERL